MNNHERPGNRAALRSISQDEGSCADGVRRELMKLVYYKSDGVMEQKTTLDNCLNIAERRGINRDEAREKLLNPNIGEVVIGHIRLWSEEAMHSF